MLTELYQITSIVSSVCIIYITYCLVVITLRIKKYITLYMDIDKIIANNLQDTPVQQTDLQKQKTKERLIQVIASGKSKFYLGKQCTTDEIETLDDKELAKLYGRYEAVLGGLITNTLKSHMCSTYARAVEFLCPTLSKGRLKLQNTSELTESLNKGPFIDLALTSLTCKLYHEYGYFLAPLEVMILTSNFILLNESINIESPVEPIIKNKTN